MTDTFIGRQLGKYRIERKLGQGGMGMVYLGRQASLNRPVAIKILPAQMAMDGDFVERFMQEAQVIAGLQHESIVHVYDIDSTPSPSGEPIYFIVMEYVDGHNLRQRPDRGRPMGWDRVRAVGLPLARALDYAHRRGIVHRDIKPANVMVTREGKVKLMDFGIAKSAGGVKTATGSVLGTPEYMAPEQAQSGRVTPQADVYALGVLLYELATGQLPFQAPEPFAVALKHISEEPVPPRQIEPAVPEWLEAVILCAMQKDPAQRYADAAALADDLEKAGGADVSFAPTLAVTPEGPVPAIPGHGSVDLHAAPTVQTPASGARIDPGAPTLQTPASGGPSIQPTPPPPPPPPVGPPTGPGTGGPGTGGSDFGGPGTATLVRNRPVAWWPIALAVLVVAAGALWFLLPRSRDADRDAGTAGHASTQSELDAIADLLVRGELDEARSRLDAVLVEGTPGPRAKALDRRIDRALQRRRQALAAGDLLQETEGVPSELDGQDLEGLGDDGLGTDGLGDDTADGDATTRSAVAEAAPDEDSGARPKPSKPTPAGAAAAPAPAEDRAAKPPAPPVPSPRELVLRARRHKDADEYHSLRDVLRQLEGATLRGDDADDIEKWRQKVDGWVIDREKDLRNDVEDQLDELVDAVEEKELDELADVWGGALDPGTADTFQKLWSRYRKTRADFVLQSVEARDNQARFVAQVHLYGKDRGGEFELVRTVTWRGTLDASRGTRLASPFPR